MSCDLSFLCRMRPQLTWAFEPRCCRRLEHGRKRGSTTNRPRTSPTQRTGWKSAYTGFAYTPHRIAFVHNLSSPPKKAFYFSHSLLHCGGLWNKTTVGKSWNECLIIKTLSITSTPTLHSVSHRGGCWRGGGHHAVTSAAAFPGQLSGSAPTSPTFNERFCSFGPNFDWTKAHHSREKDEPASKLTVASGKHPGVLLEKGSFEFVGLFLFNHLCILVSVAQFEALWTKFTFPSKKKRMTGNRHFDSLMHQINDMQTVILHQS